MGEGKLDWSVPRSSSQSTNDNGKDNDNGNGDGIGSAGPYANDNELVNPNGEIWKWKSLEDFVKEGGHGGAV